MKAIERLYQYLEFKTIRPTVFEQEIGLSSGYLSVQKKRNADIGESILLKINDNCQDLSIDWLITGQGEMLKLSKTMVSGIAIKKGENERIPVIPVGAMAGYGSGDVQVMEYEITDSISVSDFNNKGIKYFIRASGSSMTPKYNNGDLLACRPITDMSFFEWGKVHVLDTEHGPLVKRLFPGKDGEHMECRSDNKENYPPFQIPLASVRKVALMVGVIRLE